ncbi:amino acid ABC transporter permease [Variovorax paradoxus]|uniref:Amino acid ABC transporter permease n=1 Tax=Variovorax paradoxus TaxID=34073 RepID=A0AA91DLQ0_VARPD|nr:amino acid ABC transporter permease [Variovorax paradoxus]OAK61409.1 amino acid ABC transporter permease [Variovorax paradoxus]
MTTLNWSQFLLLMSGLQWTLILTVTGFVGGAIGGLLIALSRSSENAALSRFAWAFIEVFRGTPLLMQLFVVYYGIALLDMAISPWAAVAVALTLNASAFLGEIWRGSIQALPRGQIEAAKALGLHYWPRMGSVILPQALRLSIPSTIGFLVQLLKGTSLAAIVGFTELARSGTIVSNLTYKPLLVYGIVGLIYFLLCWPLSIMGRRLETRLARADR